MFGFGRKPPPPKPPRFTVWHPVAIFRMPKAETHRRPIGRTVPMPPIHRSKN